MTTFAASSQCRNKSRLSEKTAWAVAHKLQAHDELTHAYKCSWCAYWHIGLDKRAARKAAMVTAP